MRYDISPQPFQDLEKEANTGRSSTLIGSNNAGRNSKIYSGGAKSHNTWYAIGSKHDDQGSQGSQEEMVPIGRIGVRHDVDWDAKDGGSVVKISSA